MTVHIVDIGPGGVLMSTVTPPDPGDTGTLRIDLRSSTLVSDVEILHTSVARTPSEAVRAGGAFRHMSDDNRRRLENFLRATT
jgi:PilZ domain-containing protein